MMMFINAASNAFASKDFQSAGLYLGSIQKVCSSEVTFAQ